MKRVAPPPSPEAPGYLMYEDTARYDKLQFVVLAVILAASLVPAIVYLFFDTAGAAFLFGITLLDALIFHLVFPRRYQVFNTKLRIVMGWPISWDIKLATIKEARPAPAISTWIYSGFRLATSSATAVEVVRKRGMGVIISPSDRKTFLEQLNAAIRLAQEHP